MWGTPLQRISLPENIPRPRVWTCWRRPRPRTPSLSSALSWTIHSIKIDVYICIIWFNPNLIKTVIKWIVLVFLCYLSCNYYTHRHQTLGAVTLYFLATLVHRFNPERTRRRGSFKYLTHKRPTINWCAQSAEYWRHFEEKEKLF